MFGKASATGKEWRIDVALSVERKTSLVPARCLEYGDETERKNVRSQQESIPDVESAEILAESAQNGKRTGINGIATPNKRSGLTRFYNWPEVVLQILFVARSEGYTVTYPVIVHVHCKKERGWISRICFNGSGKARQG